MGRHHVDGLDALTGLPEYRNGGLLLDTGVLRCRSSRAGMREAVTPADPWIVEWRALTVALLDELAPLVARIARRRRDALPLACILEGGTWAAGRRSPRSCAGPARRRSTVDSDGTVF